MMSSSADLSTTLNRILDTAADNLRVAKILVQLGLDPNNLTLDGLVDLKFPNAFSGAMDNRPDVSSPTPPGLWTGPPRPAPAPVEETHRGVDE